MNNPGRDRYCQRCGLMQALWNNDAPRPCTRCGGTNFDAQPKKHSINKYELTDADRDFLRCQRIDPEGD